MSLAEITERPPLLRGLSHDHHENCHDDSMLVHGRSNDVSVQREQLEVNTSEVVGEKDLIGQVVEGTDGEYYLVTQNDDNDTEVEIDEISHVKIMVGSDGSRLYVVDNDKQTAQHQPQQIVQRQQEATTRTIESLPPAEGESREPSFQPGSKGRRNRVYGACRCHECGQTFVNTARLERHLAVHQIFGSFICPLCSKTYKYEYNLFYHWRKTCRDLDEVFTQSERKDLDVNTLRSAVDELVKKKRDYAHPPMRKYINPRLEKLAVPISAMARRNIPCKACGVAIMITHMNSHLNLHRGIGLVGEPDNGCFYCDLCGLMFRQNSNLVRHWRTSCPEIQANIPAADELDEHSLKSVVSEMMKTVVCDPTQLRPMAAQSHEILREKARLYDSTTGDLDFDGQHEMEEYDYEDQGPYVFTDDMLDEDGSLMSDGNYSGGDRSKWLTSGMPVQCNECKRAFANVGRLERHMAGYHSSFGSHHCPLCGNRFKYDYNLLYHYRRSCPYTKSFIETEMRQQLDAQTLRKLVRSLAQKDLRVIQPELPPKSPRKEEYGDVAVRRDMMGQNTIKNLAQIPPNKPGIPEGKNCPLCGITFYGLPVLHRHVRAAHPRDAYFFDPETGVMKDPNGRGPTSKPQDMDGPERYPDDDLEGSGEGDLDGDDMPPELEKVDETVNHEEGPLHLCDAQGRIISQVQDLNEFQALVDSGHLDLRPSDRFMLMDSNQVVHSELIYEDSRFMREPQMYYEQVDEEQQQYEQMEEEDLEKPLISEMHHSIIQHNAIPRLLPRQVRHQQYEVSSDVPGPSNASSEEHHSIMNEEQEMPMSPRRSGRKRQQMETPQPLIIAKLEPTSPKRTRRNTRTEPPPLHVEETAFSRPNTRSSPQKMLNFPPIMPRRSSRHK